MSLDRNYGETNLDVALRFQQHLQDRAYTRSRFEPPTQAEVDEELERRRLAHIEREARS